MVKITYSTVAPRGGSVLVEVNEVSSERATEELRIALDKLLPPVKSKGFPTAPVITLTGMSWGGDALVDSE